MENGGSSRGSAVDVGAAAAAEHGPVRISLDAAEGRGRTAFSKGAGVNLLRYAPHAMLSFTFIDLYKQSAQAMLK